MYSQSIEDVKQFHREREREAAWTGIDSKVERRGKSCSVLFWPVAQDTRRSTHSPQWKRILVIAHILLFYSNYSESNRMNRSQYWSRQFYRSKLSWDVFVDVVFAHLVWMNKEASRFWRSPPPLKAVACLAFSFSVFFCFVVDNVKVEYFFSRGQKKNAL